MKPKSLLPDAMVIIALHETRLWSSLVEKTEVVVPSIICHDEVRFYCDPVTGQRVEINLMDELAAGRIAEAEATLDQMASFREQFDPLTAEGLHPGELEALAILASGTLGNVLFCTADHAAVRAMVLARLEDQGISLESALLTVNLKSRTALEPHYSEERYRGWVEEAKTERLQNTDWTRM